jgi:quercetin dioxygenase-like cupin family protein
MVFKMSKRAGSDTLYQHFGQEFVLVLKGRIELVLGGKQCVLSEGDSIYFNSSVPHAFWSVYDGTTEVLSINTPSNF